MNTGIYAAISAQTSAEKQMESITANLANLKTVGYKRQGTATQSFDEVLRGSLQRQVHTHRTTDFSQGLLDHDANPTDLALVGEGFFAVETPNGEAYTRNGRFMIDDNGVLQTLEGFPVAWDSGPGAIDPTGMQVTVDSMGGVMQGEQLLGRIAIKNFSNNESLEPDHFGYLTLTPGDAVEVPHEAEVVQGALERANVDPIVEMTQMILVQRRFERAAQIVSQLDQTYRRLNQTRG